MSDSQEITLPKSHSSSSPHVDATNLLVQSAVNDDQGRNNPYHENEFFPSLSSPPSPSPNLSPMHRLRHIFSVLHLPTNESTRHKRLTLGAFQRRAPSTSPLPPPTNGEKFELTPRGEPPVVNQDEECANINSFESVAPGTTERGNDKGKQRAHSPHRSQRLRPSTARRVWTIIGSSRHRPPSLEPQPVTIYAARPKKFYWMAPRPAKKQANAGRDANTSKDANTNTNTNTNNHAQTVQSPSARVQPSAAQPESGSHGIQSTQVQAAIQPTYGQYDIGCWGKFCLLLGCIPRPVISAALPPAS